MHQLRLHLLTPSLIALALMVLAAPAAIAEDYERGLSAYNRADYETALLEWDVLASLETRRRNSGSG